jgi:predicted DNA-binding mobile mystery protein A
MPKPDFVALQRRQLDAQLGPKARLRAVASPARGWIRTIRESLGMSMRQMAARLRITQQAVAELEKGERVGTITLASLRKVADALDCDVVMALVPRTSLDAVVERQAIAKARRTRKRVAHTMDLEAQAAGADSVLTRNEPAEAQRWRTTFLKRLWD